MAAAYNFSALISPLHREKIKKSQFPFCGKEEFQRYQANHVGTVLLMQHD